MALLTTSEAADRLNVSTRRIQHLVESGHLHQIARGTVEESSVERLLAVRGGSHRRAWSAATAWAAVAILSGAQADWIENRQRARLTARLRRLSAVELLDRSRNRAVVKRYQAHSSAHSYLSAELVCPTMEAAVKLGLAETVRIDGYLGREEVTSVVARHGLNRDEEGRVTLRATEMPLGRVRELASQSVVLGALDLAESLDARERQTGLDALESTLKRVSQLNTNQ